MIIVAGADSSCKLFYACICARCVPAVLLKYEKSSYLRTIASTFCSRATSTLRLLRFRFLSGQRVSTIVVCASATAAAGRHGWVKSWYEDESMSGGIARLAPRHVHASAAKRYMAWLSAGKRPHVAHTVGYVVSHGSTGYILRKPQCIFENSVVYIEKSTTLYSVVRTSF